MSPTRRCKPLNYGSYPARQWKQDSTGRIPEAGHPAALISGMASLTPIARSGALTNALYEALAGHLERHLWEENKKPRVVNISD